VRHAKRSSAASHSRPQKESQGTKQDAPLAFIEPCLATLRTEAPSGDEWLHELKFDGYRAQAHLIGRNARIYTRRGYDWTERFSSIASALEPLTGRRAILDGEIVVLDERGVSDFHRLQTDIAQYRSDRLSYYVFDLLHLDGRDLRGVQLIERKKRLAELMSKDSSDRVHLSEYVDAAGAEVFRQACALRAEGIVSKRRDSPYRSGRQEFWIKLKCTKSDTYPIIAFVEKLGAKPRRVASLYVGRREGERLLYAGKLKTGYTEASARDLRERLDPIIRKTSPLSVPIRKPKATWVEPTALAEVQFSGITADGLLREAVFKGVRDDLAPESVIAKPRRKASPRKPAVPRANILEWLPDAVAPTKEELREYWRTVGPKALKYLGHRPLKLVRQVHGTIFYHMGPLPPIPKAVHQLRVERRKGGEGTRLWVDDVEGLLGLVEIGAVEVHPWNATVNDIEHADTIVLDLDPGEGVSWQFVVDTALRLRDLLKRADLNSWPKLTGGKGVHVMVPIASHITHDEAHRYSKQIAEQLMKDSPARFTTSAALREREGRLFVDYLRNGRGTTAVGAYSPRVRPGFPIAAPVTWKQLERGIRPDNFSMSHLPGS
jgi:bifunctional non-homologous end joining protein LigD